MMTVTILKKKLKTRVGMFKNMGENIPGLNFLGGNFPGGSLMGGNLPGGSFPDTNHDIFKNALSEKVFFPDLKVPLNACWLQ